MSKKDLICPCLGIRRETVKQAIAVLSAQTVQDVVRVTEAGSGCMCCRCKIQELIDEQQATTVQLEIA